MWVAIVIPISFLFLCFGRGGVFELNLKREKRTRRRRRKQHSELLTWWVVVVLNRKNKKTLGFSTIRIKVEKNN